MPSPYLAVFRTPGGRGMSAAGFLARLPLSMAGIALLLTVADLTGSYAIAGAVDATWILANAALAPALARLVDRRGQRRVVGPQLVVHLTGVAVVLVLAAEAAPLWTLFVAAAAAGAVLPVVGSLVRARWAYLLGGSPVLRTAYSWESVVDEMVFVLGPVLVTFVAATLGPPEALALTALIGATGAVALLAQRGSEPPPAEPSATAVASALRLRGMPALVAVMALLGVVFAGVEVTVIATARESGRTAIAGVVLAVWSVSSMLMGLWLGSRSEHFQLRRQMLVGAVALAVSLAPLLLVHDLGQASVVLLFGGAAVSPTLIAGFSLVEAQVPLPRLTEALTWVTVGISVGFALGSPGSGWLVDHVSPQAGFWVAFLAALATVLVVAGSYRALED
ncbi:MAG: MFS transporter [Actinomycetota bacterium]|nr:MFS transporter [Actinomycetota bacterium]MDH4352415.1 MFS transporter [Actinomycetota bacterium]MDH5277952.1 MFS transporter [Actinomycetota bacterium]